MGYSEAAETEHHDICYSLVAHASAAADAGPGQQVAVAIVQCVGSVMLD